MQSSTYQTLLFDWDGTICDSLPMWLAAWKQTFCDFGVDLSSVEVVEKAFGNWQCPALYGIADQQAFVERLYGYVDQHMTTIALFPNALEVLQQLKDVGHSLGLVTSTRKQTVMPALEHNHLTNLFDVILGELEVVKHKPDPEIINKALHALHGSPQQTLMMGDSDKDILAARAAGVTGVAFFPESNSRFYNKQTVVSWQPDFVIDSWSDLVELVRAN